MALFEKRDFGEDFVWGVSSSAPQTEGHHLTDGRGESIWDTFSRLKGKITHGHTPDNATEFYRHFKKDIGLLKEMGFDHFRFSVSWSRIFPTGYGKSNSKGIDFYNRLVDELLKQDITPWLTLYHWDLPNALQESGGWTNRDNVGHFCDYATLVSQKLADRVGHWMVMNEPMVFTGAGYFLGIHAPGKRGLSSFLPAIHYTALAQSMGAKALQAEKSGLKIGTTHSYTLFEPLSESAVDRSAVNRADKLVNKLFPELSLGLGYPTEELPFLKGINKYNLSNDDNLLKHNFDFWGIQVYTRQILKYSFWLPYLKASIIDAKKRKVDLTATGWEIYPLCIKRAVENLSELPNTPDLYITENGIALYDELLNGQIDDEQRISYFKEHLFSLLQSKRKGAKIKGYFAWSLTDNFEWAYGYGPRFGLIYVDYVTQKRFIKKSGYWWKELLNNSR